MYHSGSYLWLYVWHWLQNLIFKGVLGESYRKVTKQAPAYPFFQVCVVLDGIDWLDIEYSGATPV